MAELQKSTQAGESSARFIEFVMMQAQNASLFLGLIPNPQNNQPEVNLDLARMFIDQLAMIQVKTHGNLSTEEQNVLRNALTNLQMAFYEVAQGQGKGGGTFAPQSFEDEPALGEADTAFAASETPATAPVEAPAAAAPAPTPAPEPSESRKRFTKSYGS